MKSFFAFVTLLVFVTSAAAADGPKSVKLINRPADIDEWEIGQ